MSNSLRGRLLIASPMLSDPNFFRTVVYIAHHDDEGAFGFIWNRPSEKSLADLIEDARGKRPPREDVVYYGGPVDGPLVAMHDAENLGDLCKCPVWMTSDDDQVMLIADRVDISARFFAGYSGWGPGQLESELSAGGWMVGDPCEEILWGDPDEIWEVAVKQQGHRVLQTVLPAAGYVDPSVN